MWLILLFFLQASAQPKEKTELKQNPCETPKSKFAIKNLRDLDLVSQFMRQATFYPWHQFHCNGVICTAEEYENLCYLMKQAVKQNQDPNILIVGDLK